MLCGAGAVSALSRDFVDQFVIPQVSHYASASLVILLSSSHSSNVIFL